jgi:hypothetical protein
MRALPSLLRKQLETSVLAARRAAEAASRAAIESLGVFADRRPEYLNSAQAALRNGLRAKWRQVGNDHDLLVAECAYEQWHRLLFARFLAENGLLLHPQFRAPVTLAECEELATDLGEPDAWSVAARFAAEILPGIFRLDDPCVRLRLAPEGRHALEQILDTIPAETFTADDALGWIYQFWQKDKKDEVNASERKIGGADLGPVTQLFTENYMVRFLLENSLGAWWAARRPHSPLVKGFEYLRFQDDGKPAAGGFDSWPGHVAEVTLMDPCCGSGHFLVEAFSMLWQMRAEEDGLAPVEAQDAVLRDNLFGLELDARCVQIAMFNVALQAWKSGGGWRQLPVPNIACTGIAARGSLNDWLEVARAPGSPLQRPLTKLHELYASADDYGSLLDPPRIAEGDVNGRGLFDPEWKEIAAALSQQRHDLDPAADVLGDSIASIARSAALLSRSYDLCVTNVPYRSRVTLSSKILAFIDLYHSDAAGDLATSFVDRCMRFASTCALVSPQSWLFQPWYESFRQRLLKDIHWRMLARLGAGAFAHITGEVVNVALLIADNVRPTRASQFACIDLQEIGGATAKADELRSGEVEFFRQAAMAENPDARIARPSTGEHALLLDRADSSQGICTGDYARFGRQFWELIAVADGWERQQSTVKATQMYGGREWVLLWEGGIGRLRDYVRERLGEGREGSWLRGLDLLGRRGVVISQSGDLKPTLYAGDLLDNNAAAIVPYDEADLPALWALCSSEEYRRLVRNIDSALKVTNRTLVKVPFDVARWHKVAAELYPEGLPQPSSDDPTQWLFEGQPEVSTAPLQVAVGRLVGYRWPEQSETIDLDVFADADGIVCLPAVAGEPPAADRVQQLLAAAFGESWTPAKVKELLEQAGRKKNLADWLRDDFFKQHCSLFGNRPFVWHIWDGQRDGFSALVNYHRLDRKTLEKLTYTYLGQDWVERQRAEVRDGVAGAEARLAAALGLQKRLEAILEGEAPLDIYVRWKEIYEQPIGWEPDLNDGVRLNIRPFVEAGVLRSSFNIHWRKDRGKNPDGTDRLNDVHLTLAEKIEARRRVGRE